MKKEKIKEKIKEWLFGWNVLISIVLILHIFANLTDRLNDYPIIQAIWFLLTIITIWVNYSFIKQNKGGD